MKRILLTIALVAAATPVVEAYHNNNHEEKSCHRCHTCEPRKKCCKGKWHHFRGNCNRCDWGCAKNA